MNTVVEPVVVSATKKYYAKNRDAILAKEKENKRWLSYYERNKEAIRERNLIRYYAKQGRERPEPRPVIPPPDNSKIEKLEKLVAELRELVPTVMKPKRAKKVVVEKVAESESLKPALVE
jgi:thymidylate synthase